MKINSILIRKYGITLDDYEQLLKDQNYRCAICGHHCDKFKNGLGVDHNHKTGETRGLLCVNCNAALGNLKESPRRVLHLLEYMEKWDCWNID